MCQASLPELFGVEGDDTTYYRRAPSMSNISITWVLAERALRGPTVRFTEEMLLWQTQSHLLSFLWKDAKWFMFPRILFRVGISGNLITKNYHKNRDFFFFFGFLYIKVNHLHCKSSALHKEDIATCGYICSSMHGCGHYFTHLELCFLFCLITCDSHLATDCDYFTCEYMFLT